MSPLLRELHLLPICFQVLVTIFKTLHDLEPGYLKDPLSPFISTQPIRTGRQSMLQITFVRVAHLVGPQERTCLVGMPSLWNIIPPEVRTASTLIPFPKSPEDMVFSMGLRTTNRRCSWLSGWSYYDTAAMWVQECGILMIFMLQIFDVVSVQNHLWSGWAAI